MDKHTGLATLQQHARELHVEAASKSIQSNIEKLSEPSSFRSRLPRSHIRLNSMRKFWAHVEQEMEGDETVKQYEEDKERFQEADANIDLGIGRRSQREYARKIIESTEADIERLQDAKSISVTHCRDWRSLVQATIDYLLRLRNGAQRVLALNEGDDAADDAFEKLKQLLDNPAQSSHKPIGSVQGNVSAESRRRIIALEQELRTSIENVEHLRLEVNECEKWRAVAQAREKSLDVLNIVVEESKRTIARLEKQLDDSIEHEKRKNMLEAELGSVTNTLQKSQARVERLTKQLEARDEKVQKEMQDLKDKHCCDRAALDRFVVSMVEHLADVLRLANDGLSDGSVHVAESSFDLLRSTVLRPTVQTEKVGSLDDWTNRASNYMSSLRTALINRNKRLAKERNQSEKQLHDLKSRMEKAFEEQLCSEVSTREAKIKQLEHAVERAATDHKEESSSRERELRELMETRVSLARAEAEEFVVSIRENAKKEIDLIRAQAQASHESQQEALKKVEQLNEEINCLTHKLAAKNEEIRVDAEYKRYSLDREKEKELQLAREEMHKRLQQARNDGSASLERLRAEFESEFERRQEDWAYERRSLQLALEEAVENRRREINKNEELQERMRKMRETIYSEQRSEKTSQANLPLASCSNPKSVDSGRSLSGHPFQWSKGWSDLVQEPKPVDQVSSQGVNLNQIEQSSILPNEVEPIPRFSLGTTSELLLHHQAHPQPYCAYPDHRQEVSAHSSTEISFSKRLSDYLEAVTAEEVQ